VISTNCDQLRSHFSELRTEYQLEHGLWWLSCRNRGVDTTRSQELLHARGSRVGYPSVINFEGPAASGAKDLCDLLWGCIGAVGSESVVRTTLTEDVPFGSFQFTIIEVEIALCDLDDDKGPDPDNVCLYLFWRAARVLLPYLSHFVFFSFVTPIIKSGRQNDVTNYRRIAVLSAIPNPKLSELLVYMGMYESLKNLITA
jgi:hypothetical protein